MEPRKSFLQLSKRQKIRRIEEETAEDFEKLEEELDAFTYFEQNRTISDRDDGEILSLNYEHDEETITNDQDNDSNIENPTQLNIHIPARINFRNDRTLTDDYDYFLSTLSINDDSDVHDSDESDSNSDNETSDEEIIVEAEPFSLKDSLKQWYVTSGKIGREDMSDLLKILRKAGHYELQLDARTLLKTPKHSPISNCEPGEYLHYGLEKALNDLLQRNVTLPQNSLIDINLDGLPISKSTKKSLWPILGKIIGQNAPPFLIGSYHGKDKPKSLDLYLHLFIDEFKKLIIDGFDYDGRTYKITLRSNICDSPARSYVTATKQHNSTFGCSKCFVEGTYNNRMTFNNHKARLRTDETFRNREQEEHHTGTSPFEDLPIDMINQFPLDYMHLVCLGATKMILKLWIKFIPKFTGAQTNQLSEVLVNLNKYIPKEFNRKLQPLLELGRWKATTLRLFLLYVGPVVLDNDYLPNDYILHFNCLSLAIRLFCHPEHCVTYFDYASNLLDYFVNQFQELYTLEFVTYTIHNLVHLSKDVERYGPLDSFSAFEFENYMQFLKKIIRKHDKPLQQLYRRISEGICPSKKQSVVHNNPKLLVRSRNGLPFNCTDSHKKLLYKSFEFTLDSPNNCCILKDKKVVVINYIGKYNDEAVIIGGFFEKKVGISNYPMDSTKLDISIVSQLSSLKIFSAKSICTKACLFFHKNQYYVIPLLHL